MQLINYYPMNFRQVLTHMVFILAFVPVILNISCKPGSERSQKTGKEIIHQDSKRFFSDSSFWNQPIPADPEIDPQSEHWIGLLKTEPSGNNFGINATKWTVPVYYADSNTSRYDIGLHFLSDNEKDTWMTEREHFGHGPNFGKNVPIPEYATPDPEQDAHFAVVDWHNRVAWDMWGLENVSGDEWITNTGMKYSLDGQNLI